MNKCKRAKEWIDSLDDDWSRVDIEWEAVDEIRELLDKATPKKPEIQEIGQYIIRYVGKCECGEFIARSHKYCHGCGQRLDWSKDE